MTLTLDLLRHGETELGGGFRGSIDDALTAQGWQQMQDSLSGRTGWSAVVSSPLRRCADFAAGIAEANGCQLIRMPGLREMHFGDWEGRSASELMHTSAEALGEFWADPYAFTPPAAEPMVAFADRVLAAVGALPRAYPQQHLLVVTHGGVMRLLLARARGLPAKDLLQVEVPHGGLFRLRLTSNGELSECPC
ncbi:MAG: alpha-ribazole phosphatase family protein [Gammaproteobacteria bacterium]|nr:alpha-ribazole phosphatase family protein [Gammaproteobacteria bacterium]